MKVVNYIKDVKGEMKHVAWPTRRQITVFTTVVIVISLATAYFLGAFDFLFTKALDIFII